MFDYGNAAINKAQMIYYALSNQASIGSNNCVKNGSQTIGIFWPIYNTLYCSINNEKENV
jgi:hypothetical protein